MFTEKTTAVPITEDKLCNTQHDPQTDNTCAAQNIVNHVVSSLPDMFYFQSSTCPFLKGKLFNSLYHYYYMY